MYNKIGLEKKEVEMRKIVSFLVGLLLLFSSFSYCQTSKKEEIIKKIVEKYVSLKNVSGEVELGMLMMGNMIKIPVKFWIGEKKFRMEMVFADPKTPEPIKQTMVFDGKKFWIYQSKTNTVTVMDFSKLPKKKDLNRPQDIVKIREKILKSISENIKKISKNISLSEKQKNGKKFYVLEIKNLTKEISIPSEGKKPFFTKAVIWVSPDYYIKRIELYGQTKEEPGILVEFKRLKEEEKIDPSVFKFKVPEGAKVIDMGERIKENLKKLEEMKKKNKKGE